MSGLGLLRESRRALGRTELVQPLVRRRRARRAREAEERSPAPSFRWKAFEARRIEQHLRHQHGVVHPVWAVNDKDTGLRYARSLGLDVPRVLAESRRAADLDLAEFPDAVVVKSRRGASARGVLPIVREEPGPGGAWRVLSTGQRLDDAGVVAAHEAAVAAGGCSAGVIVEELLQVPELPDTCAPDWRAYCFGEEIGFWAERVVVPREGVRHVQYRYWTPDWEDLGPVRLGERVDRSLPPPRHPEELAAAARAVAGPIRRPHLRVDLYDVERGVVFGELTPHPGLAVPFHPDLDLRFGRMWEEAEARLRLEHGLAAGWELPQH